MECNKCGEIVETLEAHHRHCPFIRRFANCTYPCVRIGLLTQRVVTRHGPGFLCLGLGCPFETSDSRVIEASQDHQNPFDTLVFSSVLCTCSELDKSALGPITGTEWLIPLKFQRSPFSFAVLCFRTHGYFLFSHFIECAFYDVNNEHRSRTF
jgi:hypothetical protein